MSSRKSKERNTLGNRVYICKRCSNIGGTMQKLKDSNEYVHEDCSKGFPPDKGYAQKGYGRYNSGITLPRRSSGLVLPPNP